MAAAVQHGYSMKENYTQACEEISLDTEVREQAATCMCTAKEAKHIAVFSQELQCITMSARSQDIPPGVKT